MEFLKLFGLAAALFVAACSPTIANSPCPRAPQEPVPEQESRKVVIGNSQILELHSEQTGRDYELIVGLPPSYGKDPSRTYRVLYLLDGNWDFVLVNHITGGLRYDKVVDEFVVVGIGYGGENPDYGELRGEDYAPTRTHPFWSKEPYGGDGAKFLAFLEESVFPTIEGRFRVDGSRRMLSGTSLGGLFVLYALFEKPELFETVLAISPAVGWDERLMFRREQEFRAQHPRFEKHLWLSVGDSEWAHFTKAAQEFMAQVQASKYEGLDLGVRLVDGERHAGGKPEAYNRALRFAFKQWAAQQPPQE